MNQYGIEVLQYFLNFHFRHHTHLEKRMNEDNLTAMIHCGSQNPPFKICHHAPMCRTQTKYKMQATNRRKPEDKLYAQNIYLNMCASTGTNSVYKEVECCQNASLIGMKLLRYEMETILEIMKKHKDAVMFHLIRDPRAIINSFKKKNQICKNCGKKLPLGILKVFAKKVCSFMSLNLKLLQSTENGLDSRIRFIRHEDFANDPLKFTMSFYDTLSLKLPQEVRLWIKKITNPMKKRKSTNIDTMRFMRPNATKTATEWKTNLSIQELKVIDKECSDLYKLF